MTLRPLRLLVAATVLAVALAFALPAVGTAAGSTLTTDRGVVQSVGGGQIVLRALDGSVVSFAVSSNTRVKLNGIRVSLDEIRPGLVAAVVHNGAAPATVVRAFGKPAVITDRGIVTALSKTALTLRTPAGAAITVPIDAGTRFRLFGLPGRRAFARPGARVAVQHENGGPAKIVNVLQRAGA